MRRIIYIYSTHCPRCSYVRMKIIDRVCEVFPYKVDIINGDTDRKTVKKFNIRCAPTIIYMDGEKEIGRTCNAHWSADKIVKWLGEDND